MQMPIAIDSTLLDRLLDLAAQRGITANELIEEVLDHHVRTVDDERRWRVQVDLAKAQVRSSPSQVWEECMDEFRGWA